MARSLAYNGMEKSAVMKTRITVLTLLIALTACAGFANSANLNFSTSQNRVLQLTLASFTGQVTATGSVLIDWKTMMELNNKYFIVERSNDGLIFQQLGQVASQQNDSTTAFQLNYIYSDKSPLPGTSYYRLEMVDKDGNSTFTNIIQVYNEQLQGIKVYPTVVENNSMFVETDKSIRNAKMEVYDLSGKKINDLEWQELSGRQNFSLAGNYSRLAPGSYIVRLTSNGENLLHQLIIVQSR